LRAINPATVCWSTSAVVSALLFEQSVPGLAFFAARQQADNQKQ
jgi:hypothetical protein